MKVKVLLSLVLIAAAVVLSQGLVLANDFNATMGDGSVDGTTPYVFEQDQVPWLHLVTTTPAFDHMFSSTWSWKDAVSNTWKKVGYTGDNEQTNAVSTWYDLGINWAADERLGQWKIVTGMDDLCEDCSIKGKCTFFQRVNVPVPEPISSSLFLLGAGALGLKMFRKRKA